MADSGIVVNDGDLIADQRSAADMGSSVSAVELMAEQQAPGLSGVHHQHQHQHQYPALSLSHMVPRQYPFMHHPQQPTLEQVAAASYQQAIGGYLPTAIPTPTAACFCQCVYNPSGYPQSCAIHRTMSLPTQQFLMPQPTAMYADAAGPSYLHPAPPNMPTMLNAMRIPPPQAAARGVSANNRNQHKRQLHESISVTSSSDDDDINVAGGRDESLVAGSSKGPRKSLRVHSPPKTTELSFGGGRSTDTIDLAASSDDDEVIEPGDPAPSAVMPSSSISPVLAAQMHVPPRNHSSASAIDHRPPPSATVQSLQPDQQCRYAHCNCHSHACGCVQCPVAAHCHHFHHHHHAPQLSCQLHSPCGCGTPTNA
uniref:Uncharacterized protein n=1 Tax=Plectus sambesii TaxID=2011161 RepID=A0A914WJV2_9BILA